MLTVPEAAKRLGRNPETVRRWIRAGKLTAWKIGTQHVIDEDDVADAARGVFADPAPRPGPAQGPDERGIVSTLRQDRAERVHRLHEVAAPYLVATDRGAMTDTVNIHDAKTHLSRLVERVEGGEEVIIARAGRPVARLVPYRAQREPRQPGLLKGKIWLAEDWDSPEVNAEIAALFEG